ncbi:MAG: hypothetical protein M5R36_12800 [Deltaproteobacteria bacterium]|nr:hypothetical protein [Deltaproteobacteria bacterium]
MRAINMSKQAEWQDRVARSMKTFDVAGIDATHNEMIRKIEEKVAKSQARLEVALDKDGLKDFEIEKQAKRQRADAILRQFEQDLGLGARRPPRKKTMGAERGDAEQKDADAPAKTMGREKVGSR